MRSYAKYCSVKAFLCQWKLQYVVPMIRLKHKVLLYLSGFNMMEGITS